VFSVAAAVVALLAVAACGDNKGRPIPADADVDRDGPVATADGPVATPDGPVATPDGATPDSPTPPADGPVAVTPTAFRLTTLFLRDPHIQVSSDTDCFDVTDPNPLGIAVNDLIATNMTTDADGDTFLDFSPVLIFRPLGAGAPSGPVDFAIARCTAAMPTSCTTGPAAPTPMTATNAATGTCLAPISGTTSGYTPPVGTTPAACFATADQPLHIELSGIPVNLIHTQIAATYEGDPATGLTSGLLRGFLTEAEADMTFLPASLGLGDDVRLSLLLSGGNGNPCMPSDKDTVDGVSGWWFYLNFTAAPVPWTDPAP